MPVLAHAHGHGGRKFFFIGAFAFVVACSESNSIDFFKPSNEASGGTTGGSAGALGGTDSGGSSGGGTTSTGGASGNASGGTAGANGGTAGDAVDTGGTTPTGGTDPGGGAGGMPLGGTGGKGGGGGSPTAGDGGAMVGGMGGTGGTQSGAGPGGAGMSGASTAGSDMGGAGTGGAGTGGGATGGGGAAGSTGCTPTVPPTERCDGIDNNCMGGVDEGNACPDNCTGATRAGHAYMFCSFETATGGTRMRTWMQAEDFCNNRSMSLVFIESAEEDQFVLDWITSMMLTDQVWMGANDRDPTIGLSREGMWVWGTANGAVQFWRGAENGMPVMNRYNDWAGGEPNNQGNEDCGVLSADYDFHWDDRACSNTYPNFVCESVVAITPN